MKRYNMLNISDLNYTIDSLAIKNQEEYTQFSNNIYERAIATPLKKAKLKTADSVFTGNILDYFETKNKAQIVNIALNSTRSTNQIINTRKTSFKISKTSFNKHIIALHEKIALGFACVILFFVGAPLGALIRKGGLGLPMIVAILLFLTYHFIGIFATNSAKNGNFNPVLATWFSTLVMLPLGIILTKKATGDRDLFGFGNLIEPLKLLFNIKENSDLDYKFMLSYTNEKLINLIKNNEELGFDETTRFKAIELLNSRGVTFDEIRENGIELEKQFDSSKKSSSDFKVHSLFSISLYFIGLVLFGLFFIFRNNNLSSLASASMQICLISLVLYLFYYIKTYLNLNSFYKNVINKNKKPNFLLIIIGFPFYFITYFLLTRKVNDDLKQNCLDCLK